MTTYSAYGPMAKIDKEIDDALADVTKEMSELRSELAAERAKVARLREALGRIAEGCSFPSDDVQRACRDVARAALKDTQDG